MAHDLIMSIKWDPGDSMIDVKTMHVVCVTCSASEEGSHSLARHRDFVMLPAVPKLSLETSETYVSE